METRDNTAPSNPTDTKMCSHCKETKPAAEFYTNERRCRVCCREKAKSWNRANRDRFNENKRKSHHRNKHGELYVNLRGQWKRARAIIKEQVFEAYGKQCACCGESNPVFLTIDHVANNGSEHRRQIWGKPRMGSGSAIYAWLKKNGFPPGFQALCFNCNCGKHRNGGVCPHLSIEGVTTIPKGSTLKRGEVRSTQQPLGHEIVCSASRDAAVPTGDGHEVATRGEHMALLERGE